MPETRQPFDWKARAALWKRLAKARRMRIDAQSLVSDWRRLCRLCGGREYAMIALGAAFTAGGERELGGALLQAAVFGHLKMMDLPRTRLPENHPITKRVRALRDARRAKKGK